MEPLLHAMASNVVISVIGGCVVIGMVLRAITTIVTSLSRERSRREIAAFIAEGSITPEQGERLIRADVNRGHSPV
ncbi:MAG: hypothetical protein ACYTGG_05870 [Planctomycetota bacterium]|jgi:hypothetical protein